MIVRESIEFKRGIGSKASLGIGEKALINKWLEEYVEENSRGYPRKDPFKYSVNPDTNEIKLTSIIDLWDRRQERWPDYILGNLDTRAKFLVGTTGDKHKDLVREAFDEGFMPSISLFKKFWSRIKSAIGEEKFRDLILHLFPNRLPDDLIHLGPQNFSEEEIEKYFSNPEFRVSDDLIDRPELENKQDYEQAEMNLEKEGFVIISTNRQRNNKTIMVESPEGYKDYTISIGGRLGARSSTGSIYNNPKGTYVQMAQVLIDKVNKKRNR